MKCSFLKLDLISCTANDGRFNPSEYEREEYCTNNRHKLCPFYCSVRSDGKFRFTREMRLRGVGF